ncbi:MAG: outer membrane protein assembly factor BamA [Gammaproteobacteria bacterium]|nr:MAG: outer membrane protein assembly factor BamA [Gammaproteobacteria bacterium]
MKKSNLLISLLFVLGVSQAETFTVKDVRVSGLQRITAGSFFNYMPVKRGETITDADYPKIIRQLHQTGFFQDVKLSRDGNVLVIQVEERPVVSKINLDGNEEIKDKDLLKGLVALGLGEGDTFDEMKLDRAKKALLDLYHSRSKFDVIIDADARALGNGKVEVDIAIKEGISARIKQINIVGNKAFSEELLLSKIKLTDSKWHSLLSKGDQYAGEKLKADIEAIEAFYYDRGYLDFRINSTQVSLTDDKKYVYITISISEGLPYRIDKNIYVGSKLLNKEQLNRLLEYGIGDYYSRSQVRQSQINIKNALGEKGYAFADVRILPKLNKQQHYVVLTYDLQPGKRTYVRRIEFTGNYKTNDEVLRREMRQMEAATYNYSKVKRSDERIQRLPYIKSVERRTVPVPGHSDQVDVVYKVQETPNRSITGGIGYGSSSGFMLNAGYESGNFLGTGNRFRFDFSTSKSEKNYATTFTDPYFTPNGVSRTVQLYYNATDESKSDIGDWTSDNLGAFLRFGFPIDEYESYALGVGYRRTDIKTGDSTSPELLGWLKNHGKKFNEFIVDFNWTHDTRDKPIFATQGAVTRLGAEVAVPGSDEKYYKLNARNRSYFPLSENLLASVRGDVSYGDGFGSTKDIPFFRHYYAGGLTTVRGFKGNSLGPRWSNNDIKGGDLRVTGGAELILPWTFGQDAEAFRLGLFTDFGNVYNDLDDFDVGDFRYSAGAYVLWRSPIGPLNLSYAVPLNEKKGDETEKFQFTIGAPL